MAGLGFVIEHDNDVLETDLVTVGARDQRAGARRGGIGIAGLSQQTGHLAQSVGEMRHLHAQRRTQDAAHPFQPQANRKLASLCRCHHAEASARRSQIGGS